ncbi:hypothetical protein, partial [Aeromicrobium sp.]|uniref:hypothetical protein n=1 Tax=Aeromicrobium sp. TaxID=1871063 RepID=UPI003C609034
AALIKQTIIDGIVFALVLAVAVGWQQPDLRRHASKIVAWGALGVLGTVAAALAASAARGTSPPELFDALVTFRAQAGEVIRQNADGATTDRLLVLLATWAVSGLAIIAALALWHGLRGRDPILLATLAVIGFVSAAALLGGSYWNHYLYQLVPASALAVGLLASRVRPRIFRAVAASVVVATLANLVWTVASPMEDGAEAEALGTWLQRSGRPADTAVVAYGQPNVLAAAEMASPYPYLWSLPVRTLDPQLDTLAAVLDSPARPTWFVDWSGINSWGIDPSAVDAALSRHYRSVATLCGRAIWLDSRAQRDLFSPDSCP